MKIHTDCSFFISKIMMLIFYIRNACRDYNHYMQFKSWLFKGETENLLLLYHTLRSYDDLLFRICAYLNIKPDDSSNSR